MFTVLVVIPVEREHEHLASVGGMAYVMHTRFAPQSAFCINPSTPTWGFTNHMLLQSQRMATTPTTGVVDALNPDATTKSGGI